jgi:hypothetical protein
MLTNPEGRRRIGITEAAALILASWGRVVLEKLSPAPNLDQARMSADRLGKISE